jgi:hypothetical protein
MVLSIVLALVLAGFVTSVTQAFDCTNPNLNDNAVVGTVYIGQGSFTFEPNKTNYGSFEDLKFHGAWVKLVFPWGDSFNVFIKAFDENGNPSTLPVGALNSGPGDNLCDGKGIDTIEACLAITPPG